MSLSQSDFDTARETILVRSKSSPKEKLTALEAVSRLEQLWRSDARIAAWADGRRGDGVAKVPGLSDTLTSLARRFAACGIVRHCEVPDLYRHKCALSKELKRLAPDVKIDAVIGEGYQVSAGFDSLNRLLHGGKQPSTRAPGFTPKETVILQLLASRGSAHKEQIDILQRHVSNIRKRFKRLHINIKITTHPGEGLYTVDEKGREALASLIAGEVALPLPARRVALQLVAA